MALTAKQERFIAEYLVDLNATQAAIRAGYSEKTAYSQGQRLLKNDEIQAATQVAQEKRQERTEITQDQVLDELAAIGFSRGTDYAQITQSGHVVLTPTEELDDRKRVAVLSVKETQFGVEIKLADKVKALELLGRHLGMFDGRSGQGQGKDNNLLDAMKQGTAEDVDGDDLPEIQ